MGSHEASDLAFRRDEIGQFASRMVVRKVSFSGRNVVL